MEPLEIYIFSGFYGRMCSFPYKLAEFDNTGIHLSNYTLNKKFFAENNSSKLSSKAKQTNTNLQTKDENSQD